MKLHITSDGDSSYLPSELLNSTVEYLERIKTMTHVMEAQLVRQDPGLAELASNMAEEIDGVVERIRATGIPMYQ